MRQRATAAAGVLLSVIAAEALAAPVSSPNFDNSDFALKSAQDLFDLCTAEQGNPAFRTARAFCYGYFSGARHYHDAVAAVAVLAPLACPPASVTRDEAVTVFVEFIRAHPQKAADQPVDAVFEALATRWPCPTATAQ
jgi:hypothetical protein